MCKSNETTFKLKKSFLNSISVAFFKINRLPAVGQSNSTKNNSDINGFSPFFFSCIFFSKGFKCIFHFLVFNQDLYTRKYDQLRKSN